MSVELVLYFFLSVRNGGRKFYACLESALMNTTKMRGDDAPLLDHPGEERCDRALEIILAHTRRCPAIDRFQ